MASPAPTSRVYRPETAAALHGALERFWGRELADPPEVNLRIFQRRNNINEAGLGPDTIAALRRYGYRPNAAALQQAQRYRSPEHASDAGSFWSRFFQPRTEEPRTAPAAPRSQRRADAGERATTPRAVAPGSPTPRAVATRGPVAEADTSEFRISQGDPSRGRYGGTTEQALQLLRERVPGQLQPNQVYIVQIDRNNTTRNFGELKGTTYVFRTNNGGEPRLAGTFRSTSQPTWTEGILRKDTGRRVDAPYIPDIRPGAEPFYRVSRQIGGELGSFVVNASRANRDTNRSGALDRGEMRLVSTSAITFHADAIMHQGTLYPVGSRGCQVIDHRVFRAFARAISGPGEAIYVLHRS
ncbi:MAG: hypothetical protein ACAI38_22685 [Myxococcota bacterium]